MRANHSSAEEFYSRKVADAQVLLDASHQHALEDDVVAALATAIGSDVATLQALLWERINVAPRAPMRQFFQAGEALAGVMSEFGVGEPVGATAADLVRSARLTMTTALDDSLAAAVTARWADVSFLGVFAAPDEAALTASVLRRTGGLSVSEYIVDRRAAAARLMLEAQASRVRGASSDAIAAAYESDFCSLEAYLAESAWVVGDTRLLTAIVRWDIAVRAVSELAGLPEGFLDAVALVRSAMTGALGEGDGVRLDAVFAPA